MTKTKWSLSLFAVCTAILISASPALAISYQAGDLVSGGIGLVESYYGGSKAIYFNPLSISGPSGDALTMGFPAYTQAITGAYTLGTQTSAGVYALNLVSGTSSGITVSGSGNTYLTAQATATEINFNTHQIKWSEVTGLTINNTIGSTVLTGLSESVGYSLSFTFETLGTESTWLSGTSGTYNARALTEMQGLAATPEPAEWVLILLGLGLLGYCMNRKGMLNFEPAPQAYT